MNKTMLKYLIELTAVIVAVSFMSGCGSKETGNTTHVESGSALAIVEQISDECMKNKDTQGAQEALDTFLYLLAFGYQEGNEVKYVDVKKRNFENIEYNTGDLLIAVAADTAL